MTRRRWAAAVVACCVVAAACGGGGVAGEYIGKKGESFFDSLTFRSDGKVDVVMIGVRHEGAYEVDGDEVMLTAPNGQRTPLRLESNGCLTHPVAGIYCKGGGDGTRGGAPAAAREAPGGDGTRGGRYEARTREGQIALELSDTGQARITMVPTGIADAPERMSFDVSYAVDGDRVTVDLPGSEPLRLTRAGTDLEGSMNGETVRFVKR
jgi:hypothetical protein